MTPCWSTIPLSEWRIIWMAPYQYFFIFIRWICFLKIIWFLLFSFFYFLFFPQKIAVSTLIPNYRVYARISRNNSIIKLLLLREKKGQKVWFSALITTRGQFHQRVYAQLLHRQIPKPQELLDLTVFLRFWDLGA